MAIAQIDSWNATKAQERREQQPNCAIAPTIIPQEIVRAIDCDNFVQSLRKNPQSSFACDMFAEWRVLPSPSPYGIVLELGGHIERRTDYQQDRSLSTLTIPMQFTLGWLWGNHSSPGTLVIIRYHRPFPPPHPPRNFTKLGLLVSFSRKINGEGPKEPVFFCESALT